MACVDSIFGRNSLSHICYKGVLFSKENVTLGILHKVSWGSTKQAVQQNNIKVGFFLGGVEVDFFKIRASLCESQSEVYSDTLESISGAL